MYYCPRCGNCTQYGELFVFFKTTRLLVLKMIKEGKIKQNEQKLCFICEELEKLKSKKQAAIQEKSIVSYCFSCFDLQINGIWQMFTFEQKQNLSKILRNNFYFNGGVPMECPSCVEINSFIKERRENVYNDSFKPFDGRKKVEKI